jgi:hypothetical protein
VQFAELGERGKKGVDGAFVDPEGKFPALEAFEFRETFFDFVAKVNEALSIVVEKSARVGQANRARAADEERLAKRVLKLANGQADGRLGAIQTLGRAGKAAFLGNGQKDL